MARNATECVPYSAMKYRAPSIRSVPMTLPTLILPESSSAPNERNEFRSTCQSVGGDAVQLFGGRLDFDLGDARPLVGKADQQGKIAELIDASWDTL